ncbi:Peptidase M48 domain-containing protein [Rozella allomycis CSF55]|uniref:CAAX prenyl protease n=1 Tax=Rozella allomycis (strain CSF55) TaxID=988480 RepID=A0A075B2P4_ROZAC|nr:Peptidase M48 domain-containing protein [Rozella allomycis CSF55]|eukprot:EPZ36837.1 Peptidase M48 domain-containing protein [Rozella allomycis CSF55]
MDQFKTIVLVSLFGVPILGCVIAIVRYFGSSFYWYLFIFLVVFQFFMILVYPSFIMPLFNQFTPIEEGELRSKIFALAKKVEFPLTNLFVMDGSKRSAHSNAFFFGLFKNYRIVIFDTLLKQVKTNEVVAVVAHELGHWKLSHTMRRIVISQGIFFLNLYVLSQFILNEYIFNLFGFYGKTYPVVLGFIFFQYVSSPVDHMLNFAMNIVSRKHEYEADAFAVKHGYSLELVNALIKIHSENLSNLNPDRWYVTYHYCHPTLFERIEAITSVDIKQE